MNKEISETDWMIMGMIHTYKILDKTMKDKSAEHDMNDVDYVYLTEMQRRNIQNPTALSDEFPYVFLEINTSENDNVQIGMMNVFTLLDNQKKKGENLNTLDCEYLIDSLISVLQSPELVERYDDLLVQIKNRDNQDDLEDLK